MKYAIVAGEELKKIMSSSLPNSIPFNEDMSKGECHYPPFSDGFIVERASCHDVSVEAYKEKLQSFLLFAKNVSKEDEVDLYFGEDSVCLANRALLIEYLKPKVGSLTLHIVNEYTGEEIKAPQKLL